MKSYAAYMARVERNLRKERQRQPDLSDEQFEAIANHYRALARQVWDNATRTDTGPTPEQDADPV